MLARGRERASTSGGLGRGFACCYLYGCPDRRPARTHTGVYTASDYASILEHLLARWEVDQLQGLSGEGYRCQVFLFEQLEVSGDARPVLPRPRVVERPRSPVWKRWFTPPPLARASTAAALSFFCWIADEAAGRAGGREAGAGHPEGKKKADVLLVVAAQARRALARHCNKLNPIKAAFNFRSLERNPSGCDPDTIGREAFPEKCWILSRAISLCSRFWHSPRWKHSKDEKEGSSRRKPGRSPTGHGRHATIW